MLTDFAPRLRAFAEVIVRVSLNLQPGQRLLVAEPYELQGVARSAAELVEAVSVVALATSRGRASSIEVIWGDAPQLREFAANQDWRGFARLVAANARTMQQYVRGGDALLFLQGRHPNLLQGVTTGAVADLSRVAWEHFGPVAQQLMAGATNWTVAPAPSPEWADAAYSDLPQAGRLPALWSDVFAACRVDPEPMADPLAPSADRPASPAVAAWQAHLQALRRHRDDLNTRRYTTLRYVGDGTDLTVALPAGHVWCTAQLVTKSGRPFVANLPTEEVFTLPHRESAHGHVRVARPISHGGSTITGIDLEFRHGRVIAASAKSNEPLLRQLLATDEGADRLGEVALVGPTSGPPGIAPDWESSGRLFHHPLLDENTSHHIALGEAYGFCLRSPDAAAANRSLIHVDLPINARPELR